MRLPDLNKLKKIKVNKDIFLIKEYEDEYDVPERIVYDPDMDERAKATLVKLIERLVRSSTEYRQLINFLKEHFDMDACAYYNNVTNKDNRWVKIEVHHSPFTLYDITYIVLNKHFSLYGRNINISNIVYEILELHYRGIVGLIPLNKTIHELNHNGFILIPVKYVFGDIELFFSEYSGFMTEQQVDLYSKHCHVNDDIEVIPEFLKKNLVYIKHKDSIIPNKI